MNIESLLVFGKDCHIDNNYNSPTKIILNYGIRNTVNNSFAKMPEIYHNFSIKPKTFNSDTIEPITKNLHARNPKTQNMGAERATTHNEYAKNPETFNDNFSLTFNEGSVNSETFIGDPHTLVFNDKAIYPKLYNGDEILKREIGAFLEMGVPKNYKSKFF